MGDEDRNPLTGAKKGGKYRCRNLIADSLVAQGVEFCFGVVGYPVQEVGEALQASGLKYIGVHNEQAGSYAAGAVGFITGRPGGILTVTGPGVIHAVAGMANAQVNCWPMIALGGASEGSQDGMGSFQEARQLMYVQEACKFYQQLSSPEVVPRLVAHAVRISMAGRPGAAYLDMPANVMRLPIIGGAGSIPQLPMAPGQALTMAYEPYVQAALDLMRSSAAPLVIIGKGAQFGKAEAECKEFVELTNMPFISVPMGKGLIDDDHPNNVIAARSDALKGADVCLLVGARLNWILHFGGPPRYKPDVKFIKIDVEEVEMDVSKSAAVSLVGHAKAIMGQLIAGAKAKPFKVDGGNAYWTKLKETVAKNAKISADMASDHKSPLNYYACLTCINNHLPKDCTIMSEGANTMDIGRTILLNHLPRSRLDAGTFGTMGVGMGQILAFCAAFPHRKCVGVLGDAAFGFSAMEYETVARFNMDALVIVLNNNGIGGLRRTWGPEWDEQMGALKAPVNAFHPRIRYEKLCEVFGGKSYYVETYDELDRMMKEAVAYKGPQLMHIRIDPRANRKEQEFPFGSMQSMLAGSGPAPASAKL